MAEKGFLPAKYYRLTQKGRALIELFKASRVGGPLEWQKSDTWKAGDVVTSKRREEQDVMDKIILETLKRGRVR